MEKHQQNAMHIASFLEAHKAVKKVFYPGLKSFPQYELAKKQMTGYSSLLSFELNSEHLEAIKKFVNSLKLFHIWCKLGRA